MIVEFSKLLGKTIFKYDLKNDRLYLYCTNGKLYCLYHEQDCCESVYIEDINGDLDDILHKPILMAEDVQEVDKTGNYESATWTFYKLATINGYITIRWLGLSNGYYSESVDMYEEDCLDELRDFRLSAVIR
jgi:hypothetical protein